MVERAVLAATVIAMVCLVGYVVRQRTRAHSQSLSNTALPVELAARLNLSAAGIVYFYGPHCTTCRRQAGVQEGLSDAEDIAVVSVDASRETHLADRLGVMTVPATVVVDQSQRVHSVNVGFRSADALREQLIAASGENERSRASA